MKKKIITDYKFLRQKSEEIEFPGIEPTPCEVVDQIIKDLEDSLDLEKGIGLSAVQIGILFKVGIVRINDFKLDLINPTILEKAERHKFVGERCLSLPGIKVDTSRYGWIKINNNGKIEEYSGLEAIAIQHEIAHMNGRTILEYKWRAR